jgi:hypothetical protein
MRVVDSGEICDSRLTCLDGEGFRREGWTTDWGESSTCPHEATGFGEAESPVRDNEEDQSPNSGAIISEGPTSTAGSSAVAAE